MVNSQKKSLILSDTEYGGWNTVVVIRWLIYGGFGGVYGGSIRWWYTVVVYGGSIRGSIRNKKSLTLS